MERLDNLDPRWGKLSATHDPRLLASFQPRPTDVLIATPPKAGTTWMQQILYQLKSKGDANFGSIFDVVPWLEFPRPNKSIQEVINEYNLMEDPRIFKTHCTFEQCPIGNGCKVILSWRDPRDCATSFFYHLQDTLPEARLTYKDLTTFDEFFEKWISFGAWFNNVKSWWPHRNDPNFLWFRYEDMIEDLEGTIDRILAFLGWEISEDEKKWAIKHSSFQWMKENAIKFQKMSSGEKPRFKKEGLTTIDLRL
jgi:hypothetical protein